MNVVTLYIENTDGVLEQVDLFRDETISVTSKIQDIRDIAKVFTDFSQSFTLPASKKNNKIFRHFYNYFISEGAFDARKKVDAVLEINHIPFREGKVFLNNVKMKGNGPFSYNVTFYGNTVNLKDALGDDELTKLDLSQFDHDYDSNEVKNGLTTGINFSGNTTSIIYPLITHTKRLYYESVNSSSHTIDGNLYWQNTGANSHNADAALEFTDLKPAIKASEIISAIEANPNYNISFVTGNDNDFFDSDAFSNLYLWLSRTKGILGGEESDVEKVKVVEDWQYDSGDNFVSISPNGQEFFVTDLPSSGVPFAVFTVSSTVIPETGYTDVRYTLQLLIDEVVWAEKTNVTGNNNVIFTTQFFAANYNNKKFKVVVKSNSAFLFTVSAYVYDQLSNPNRLQYLDTNPSILSAQSQILIRQELPKMKIMDFLSGIFSMFNLTAFVEQDRSSSDYGKVKVMTLDDFYASDIQLFDITKYVESSETDIESTIPFSEINFKYSEGQTLLMKRHSQDFNEDFGDEEFKPDGVDRGKPYEVKTPFEHMKFERLFDENVSSILINTPTDIQWGYSANDNFKSDSTAEPQPTANYEPVLTKPMLFYGINVTISDNRKINWIGNAHEGLSTYWKPSNTNENGSNPSYNLPLESGTTTSTTTDKLVDSGQNFLSTVEVGDFVDNTDDSTTALVTNVDSNTTLSLSQDIFTSGEDYKIYRRPEFTLNFDNEVDEWNLIDYDGQTNSLFKNFYETYISDAFDAKKRIFKVKAYLPNSVLLKYKMSDRFQIGDKVFTINSIDTNLKTGESKLELLNVL
jgi:hypothetical protein